MAWDVLSGAAKMAWDVLSGVTKTAWDVLSGVANRCGMFCLGCQKKAWDVLSQDVLSYIRIRLVYKNILKATHEHKVKSQLCMISLRKQSRLLRA